MVNIKRLPLPLMEMYEWQYEGLCMDMDSEVFSPPRLSVAPSEFAVKKPPRPSVPSAR